MKNWRTTVLGILAILPQILSVVGVNLPAPLLNLLTAIAAAGAFYFAKDKNVTGAE